jgi:hypothetical protein
MINLETILENYESLEQGWPTSGPKSRVKTARGQNLNQHFLVRPKIHQI